MSRNPAPRRRDALRLLLALALLVGWRIFGRASFEDEIQAAQRSADRLDCKTAERELQRASSQPEALSGADPRLAEALQSLARCWGGRGRYGEAESHLERALAIRRRMPDGDLPGVAGVLHGLGWLAARSSRYAEAEAFYQEALAIRTRLHGPEHVDVAHTQGELAFLRYLEGRSDEAKELSRTVLRIRERELGPDHVAVAESVNLLGLIHRSQGRSVEAKADFERALAIHERTRQGALARHPLGALAARLPERLGALPSEHPDVGSILNNLASIQMAEGRFSEAEQSLKRAIAIFERSGSPEHPFVGSALDNLGSVYRAQARFDLAEQAYERAIRILDRALPPAHPQRATARRNLLALCRDSGGIRCGGPIGRTS